MERVVYVALVALVFGTPLCLAPWTDEPSPDLQWLVLMVAPPALLTVWMVSRALTGRSLSIARSWILYSALALLAMQVLSLFVAANRWLAMVEIMRRAGLLSLFVLAANLAAGRARRAGLLWAVTLSGLCVSIYGVAQHFGYDFFPWQQHEEVPVSRGVSFMGHSTLAASFLLLAFPMAAVVAAAPGRLIGRAFAGLCGAVMFWHFCYTGARGAALAAAVAVAAAGIAVAFQEGGQFRRKSRWAAVGLGALVTVGAGAVLVGAAWRVKDSDAMGIQQGAGAVRLYTYESAARLFLRHPLLGVGAGNYEIASPAAWNAIEADRFVRMNRMSYQVHNEYLEVAAELGIAGLGVFLALFMAALSAAFQAARRAAGATERRVGVALVATITAAAADAVLIFNLQVPGPAMLFWVALGLTDSLSREPGVEPSSSRG